MSTRTEWEAGRAAVEPSSLFEVRRRTEPAFRRRGRAGRVRAGDDRRPWLWPGPRTSYELADIATWTSAEPIDLIISNAAFQWVPDQLSVITRLRDLVAPGGTFAFQVPSNFGEPSHVLLHELSRREPYASYTEGLHGARGVDPATYLDLFAIAGRSVLAR